MNFPESEHHSSSKSPGRERNLIGRGHWAPLQWKACLWLSILLRRRPSPFPGVPGLSLPGPHSSWSSSQELETAIWRAPFQALVNSWHLGPSLPASRATSSATQEINCSSAEPSGTDVCVFTHPACVCSLLYEVACSNPANHTFHTPRPWSSLPPTVCSHLSHGLDPVGSQDELLLPSVPVHASVLCLKFPCLSVELLNSTRRLLLRHYLWPSWV